MRHAWDGILGILPMTDWSLPRLGGIQVVTKILMTSSFPPSPWYETHVEMYIFITVVQLPVLVWQSIYSNVRITYTWYQLVARCLSVSVTSWYRTHNNRTYSCCAWYVSRWKNLMTMMNRSVVIHHCPNWQIWQKIRNIRGVHHTFWHGTVRSCFSLSSFQV